MQMSINYVNLPNNVSWSTASPTVWKVHFHYRNWQLYHRKHRDLLFQPLFVITSFEDKRRMKCNRPGYEQCLGPRPLKIRSPLPVQRKKYFPPRVITVVAGFKSNSKERHIFKEIKHGFCEKMKNKKTIRKRVVKETHFLFSFLGVDTRSVKRLLVWGRICKCVTH